MTPSVSPDADRELAEAAQYYAGEADTEVGLAFIAEYERVLSLERAFGTGRKLEERVTPVSAAKISIQRHLQSFRRRTSPHYCCAPQTEARLLEPPEIACAPAS